METDEDEGWFDWAVDTWQDNVELLTDSAVEVIDAVSGGAADVAGEIGDAGADAAIGTAFAAPIGISVGAVLGLGAVAVALNPSLLTNAAKDFKKLF